MTGTLLVVTVPLESTILDLADGSIDGVLLTETVCSLGQVLHCFLFVFFIIIGFDGELCTDQIDGG